MKILFCASECVPFAKTGGLADVVGALPKALERLGHEVKIVMPRYYDIDRNELELVPGALGVPMGPLGTLWAGVYRSHLPKSGVEVYFIDYEIYFGRKNLYTDEHGFSYVDNDQRFAFLSKASLELAKKIDFMPDIVHAHDWHTAAIPALVKTVYKKDFANTKSVLTIHNLQHQGVFDCRVLEYLHIDSSYCHPFYFEALGAANLLKGGIALADIVTTVSKKYAKEIQTPEFGFGLEEHIKAHANKLYGILNGVDYDEWNPASDRYIVKNYDIDTLEDKKVNKRHLQELFSLVPSDKPLIGYVGRFAQQKGIELIAAAMERLLHMDAQFVMLGTGEKWAEGFFSDVAGRYDNFRVYVGYSNELAHKIEAGSDIFLMPSLFEPCGLNQIYSLRYGTPPLVRATGGLDDTIENYDATTKSGTGFKFYDATPEALIGTLHWAIDVYENDKEGFLAMQKEAMQKRFDWMHAAKEYEKLYICKE